MKLSIQSKLMLMLLSVCISSIMVIAYVGYDNGRQALNQAIENQLVSVREAKAYQIEKYFQQVRAQIQTFSKGGVEDTVKVFIQEYQALEKQKIQLAWNEQLKDYYEKKFLSRLAKNTAGRPLLYSYYPQNAAARYLQYYYTAANSNPVGEKEFLDDANDGSGYSKVRRSKFSGVGFWHEKHFEILN